MSTEHTKAAMNSDCMAYSNAEADARRISAAPEMLEALEAVRDLLQEGFLQRDTSGDGEPDWAIKVFPKLRKLALVPEAIAKARGSASSRGERADDGR